MNTAEDARITDIDYRELVCTVPVREVVMRIVDAGVQVTVDECSAEGMALSKDEINGLRAARLEAVIDDLQAILADW